MAVATYVPAGLLALGWVVPRERERGFALLLALLTIVCALLTLYTTGMIYASLRTIRQWHQPLTAPIYVALGLASGAVLLNLLLRALRRRGRGSAWLAIVCAGRRRRSQMGLLAAHRRRAARPTRPRPRPGSATSARCARWSRRTPQPNFIMREMGYRVARKHAKKLRKLALLFAFAVPIADLPAVALHATGFGPSSACGSLAVLSMAVGLLHRALAVLRRGRARVDALLRRRCGLSVCAGSGGDSRP